MQTKFGKYAVKSELGKGAMGIVYLAEDERLARPVALKVMSSSIAGDPELLKRFYREAQSAGQLRHPNIVTIYDIDEANGVPFIAMEYLDGDSLEKIIAERMDIPLEKKLDIGVQVSRGLHYAHEHGIIHRDVKPANIVVLKDGLVKIVDFGIAHVGGDSMTRTGTVLGTPAYMAPEQVRGQIADARSDLYSLGIVLYELITYQNPLKAKDITTVFYRIVNQPLPPLTDYLPDCPPQLQKIVLTAGAKERDARYASVGDIAFELQQVGNQIKRNSVLGYIKQGEEQLNKGEFARAKNSLQKALAIDSSYDIAKELLAKVQIEIQAQEKKEKVNSLLTQAKTAMEMSAFEPAATAAEEVLRLDPEHPEAKQIRDRAIELHERDQKVKQLMEQAEKMVARGDLQSAKGSLDAILAADPGNASAVNLLSVVTKSLAEQERSHKVQQLTESARTQLAQDRFDDALALCEEAKQLEPDNLQIESLVRLIRSTKAKRERQMLLEDKLGVIQKAFQVERFDEAERLAEEGLKQFPNESQILKLRTQASYLLEAQRRRQYVDREIEVARTALAQNDFGAALKALEQALEKVPDDPRLISYLKGVQDAQERAEVEKVRQQALRDANELIRNKEFAEATGVLEQALARVGESTELSDFLQFVRDQKSEHARRQQTQKILAEAHDLVREDKYKEAIELLEGRQGELRTSEVTPLLTSIRAQWQKFEEKKKASSERAEEFLRADKPEEAVTFLENSPPSYFTDEHFQEVYKQCREAADRAVAVRKIASEATQWLEKEDYERAKSALREALELYPANRTLSELLKHVEEDQNQSQRNQLAKVLNQAKVQTGRMQYQEALLSLNAVDWATCGFDDLGGQANKLRQEIERRAQDASDAKTILAPRRGGGDDATIAAPSARGQRGKPPSGLGSTPSGNQSTGTDTATRALQMPSKPSPAHSNQAEATESLPVARDAQTILQKVGPAANRGAETKTVVMPRATPPRGASSALSGAEASAHDSGAQTTPPQSPQPSAPPGPMPGGQSQAAPAPPAVGKVSAPPAVAKVATREVPMGLPSARPAASGSKAVYLLAAAAIVVLALSGFFAWRHFSGGSNPRGSVLISAAPWAQIVSVKTSDGKDLGLHGETPLRLELPPGSYVIQLKHGSSIESVQIAVKSGEATTENYTFPDVNVQQMVQNLISSN